MKVIYVILAYINIVIYAICANNINLIGDLSSTEKTKRRHRYKTCHQ